MVIINLPRHLWKRPTAGVYIYCVAVGSYCLSATQWVEPFCLNQRLCPPLSHSLQPSARFAPLFLLFSPFLTLLSTIFHTLVRTALHSFLLCPCPLRLLWPGGENMEGMKGREMGVHAGVRASQNRDGVPSPPWVWISICAVGWQLQTSLSADGFDQRCHGSIVANEGTGACELLCQSLLTWLSVAAPIHRWLPWQLTVFPSLTLRMLLYGKPTHSPSSLPVRSVLDSLMNYYYFLIFFI